jgi:hypothetical protein
MNAMPHESIFGDEERANCRSCTVWLHCDIVKAVDARAQADNVSASEVIKRALSEYLDLPSTPAK